MEKLLFRWISFLVLTTMFACGDDDGGADPTAATASDLKLYCDSLCAWQTKCSKGTPTCQTECAQRTAKTFGKARADIVQAIAACHKTLTCSEKTDTCFGVGLAKVIPDYNNDPLMTSCLAAYKTCSSAGKTPFSDDHCWSAMLLTDTWKTKVKECLAKPCAQVGACLDAIFGG